jgi:hypothetical protein
VRMWKRMVKKGKETNLEYVDIVHSLLYRIFYLYNRGCSVCEKLIYFSIVYSAFSCYVTLCEN